MARSLTLHAVAALVLPALLLLGTAPAATATTRALEIEAALNTSYLRGVSVLVAEEVLKSPSDVRIVLQVLSRGFDFPRQDNTLAFLGHVSLNSADWGRAQNNQTRGASNEISSAVLEYLVNVTTQAPSPELWRSALLVPHALGLQAQRGSTAAVNALTELTDALLGSGSLLDTVSSMLDPGDTLGSHDSMAEECLLGLGFAKRQGSTVAATRLATLETDLSGRLKTFLGTVDDTVNEIWDQRLYGTVPSNSVDGILPVSSGSDPDRRRAIEDNSQTTDALSIGWCNHVSTTLKVDSVFADAILDDAARITSKAHFDDDVSCCLEWRNAGTSGPFGTSGDGLDRIDNEAELNAVFNKNCGRVKVVNMINFCGAASSNILGCAPLGGDTLVVVRLTSLSAEAKLWAHEVGHNAGLSHNGISAKFIMFSTLSGDSDENLGLTQQECSSFHNPPISSKLFPSIVNTNCSLKIGDNDSSGDGGISTSRLIIYVAIGVVGLVLLLVIASELYRRSNRRRAMHSHNAALAEAGTGSGVASHRAHMPPAYPMTSRPPAYK